MKDKAEGYLIAVCWIKVKDLSYLKEDDTKKTKGIKKSVIEITMKHEEYKKTLFEKNQMRHKMKIIQSIIHQLEIYDIKKMPLPCFDDKRFTLDDRNIILVNGHKYLK